MLTLWLLSQWGGRAVGLGEGQLGSWAAWVAGGAGEKWDQEGVPGGCAWT